MGPDTDRTRDSGDLVMLCFRVPSRLKERLEAVAIACRLPMQDIARRGIETEIEVREEVLDERRAAFERLAADENARRLAKRAKRASHLHDEPMTP